MKNLATAALLLSLAACGIQDATLIEQRRVRTEVSVPEVHNEPSGGQLQYMAYCNDEERALSDWCDSRSEAESKVSSYRSEHPDRACSILWRQKPSGRMTPKYPRG